MCGAAVVAYPSDGKDKDAQRAVVNIFLSSFPLRIALTLGPWTRQQPDDEAQDRQYENDHRPYDLGSVG